MENEAITNFYTPAVADATLILIPVIISPGTITAPDPKPYCYFNYFTAIPPINPPLKPEAQTLKKLLQV